MNTVLLLVVETSLQKASIDAGNKALGKMEHGYGGSHKEKTHLRQPFRHVVMRNFKNVSNKSGQ